MRNLLAVWRGHDLDEVLRRHERRASCSSTWTPRDALVRTAVTRVRPPTRTGAGTRLHVPGSLSVHYDGDPARRPVYLDAVANEAMPGYGADDRVRLLLHGRELVRIVSLQPTARSPRVIARDGAALETLVEPELLASAPSAGQRAVPEDIRSSAPRATARPSAR